MRLSWDVADHYRVWTVLAVLALGYGAYLAVFGLPPVRLHLPTHWLGIMTPGCGGTRAMRQAMLGEWGKAWEYNPASPVIAVGAALMMLRAVAGWVTGRWLTVRLRRRWIARLAWIVLAVLVGALWVRQQLHAELLMGP
ncbi:DUF2752 domain-containing protein [Nonomuraea rubra]